VAQKKIEEWIREIEERPSSAPLILNYIASRLQELTARNEELLAEIIALQSGNRVEEFERRIAHLEYQLELLKRGVGANPGILEGLSEMGSSNRSSQDLHQNLIIYSPDGRILRLPLSSQNLRYGHASAAIADLPEFESEHPRMLAVDSKEELLFLFTTGRIATLPLSSIQAEAYLSPHTQPELPISISWQQSAFPVPPRTSESLACVLPISQLSLADFFVQVSRRGFLKKIRIGMADGILQNRYIGLGIHKPPDRTFELLLCKSADRIALVSWEARWQSRK